MYEFDDGGLSRLRIHGTAFDREMSTAFAVLSSVWFLMLMFSARYTNAANIPPQEMQALQDLYNSTDGTNWVWYDSDGAGIPWSFTADANPCVDHWQGILCELDSTQDVFHVKSIELNFQNLVGQLPNTLAQLTHLTLLELPGNHLNGTIPETLSTLTNLTKLILSESSLDGQLPAFLGSLPMLQTLELNDNHFVGTFPEQWLDGPQLQFITVLNNQLTGTIPSPPNDNSPLRSLSMANNDLSGTFPATLLTLKNIEQLVFDGNYLTGTIPTALSNIYNLTMASFGGNLLTGPLPALEGLPLLSYASFENNYLTGTLSDKIGASCASLATFEAELNFITGSIPFNMGNATGLQVVIIDSNYLTGTIPESLGRLMQLVAMIAFHNLLTGTIPSYASPLLGNFELDHNLLSGNLDHVFRRDGQLHLQTIILGNNQLTGTLPVTLFRSQALLVLDLNSNCFHGSLPDYICHALGLTTLVLDGLGASPTCTRSRVAEIFGINAQSFGTISSCLFELPNITTLHLAGNGLTGTLPSDVHFADTLYDITLSHNDLTGTVPSQVQERMYYRLDLSYNRLSGTLISNFWTTNLANFTYLAAALANRDDYRQIYHNIFNESAPEYINFTMTGDHLKPSVQLVNNRLSGRIPAAFQTLPDVSILGTNLFSCRLDGSDLPPADNGDGNYQCGSSAFDVPYYVWLSVCALTACGAVCVWRRWPVGRSAVQRLLDVNLFQQVPAVLSFLDLLNLACRTALLATAAALVVLLPTYCALSAYYGEYTYEYAYAVSAAFLSGATPAAVEFVLWTLQLLVLCASSVRWQRSALEREIIYRRSSVSTAIASVSSAAWTRRCRAILSYAALFAINITIVVVVNIVYVYIAVYQSAGLLTFAQVLLSFFKLAWSNLCTSKVVQTAAHELSGQTVDRSSEAAAELASVQVMLGLLNNILIPCLVVAAVSPSCFYNAFVSAPNVVSFYVYTVCELLDEYNACLIYGPQLGRTTYQPTFVYDYQCSSSMITYYAPAFVNMCIISTFLNTLAQVLCLALYRRAAPGGRWQAALRYLLPRLLHPRSEGVELLRRSAYNANRLVTVLCTYVGILMTFGIVFPPLAVAIAVTVVSVVYFARLKFGWYASSSEQQADALLRVLDADCAAIGSPALLVHNVTWMVIVVSSWFYTLFLFDTLGDAVGFEGAYWVLIVMPLLPVVLYTGCMVYNALWVGGDRGASEASVSQQKAHVAEGGVSVAQVKRTGNRAMGVVLSPFAVQGEDGSLPL